MKKYKEFKNIYSLLKKDDKYFNINSVTKPTKLNYIKQLSKKSVAAKYTATLDEMINRVNTEPKPKMIYSGIKEKSIGIIFGPSKSGKTMYCENLGMCIASGENQYLDLPIEIENRKVISISLEEHIINSTGRNISQIKRLVDKHGNGWLQNYIVKNEKLHSYLDSKDWNVLAEIINEIQPGVVFLDSLTHMYDGNIEDSKTAKGVMQKIRELSEKTKTTIIVIHHTTKLYDRPISMDTVAGSRVIAQECDFMIGINKISNGTRYIKEVAFRYSETKDELVQTFIIDNDSWLNGTGETDEFKLLAALDGRRDEGNKEILLDFIKEQNENGTTIIPFKIISDAFVINKQMSCQSAHTNLNKLVKENKIIRLAKGEYKLAA